MENLLQRITFDPRVLHGKPLIRGLRISVEMILELLAKGANKQEILEDYPELEAADIQAVLSYAQHLVAGEVVIDLVPGTGDRRPTLSPVLSPDAVKAIQVLK